CTTRFRSACASRLGLTRRGRGLAPLRAFFGIDAKARISWRRGQPPRARVDGAPGGRECSLMRLVRGCFALWLCIGLAGCDVARGFQDAGKSLIPNQKSYLELG